MTFPRMSWELSLKTRESAETLKLLLIIPPGGAILYTQGRSKRDADLGCQETHISCQKHNTKFSLLQVFCKCEIIQKDFSPPAPARSLMCVWRTLHPAAAQSATHKI